MIRNSLPTEKIAIATITDEHFIKGTMVLLYSFLQKNSWFKGDIILISDSLLLEHKKQLSSFPNVKFKKIGEELLKRLEMLCAYFPNYKSIHRRFFSIEAFNLVEYEKVLYLDSDILCCASAEDFFSQKEYPLIAAPDFQYYLNKLREKETFIPVEQTNKHQSNTFKKVFNSGVMLVNNRLLEEATYIELLKLLTPIFYKNLQTSHTDQFLLNHFFEGKVKFSDYRYNFLLHAKEAITLKERPNLEQLVFIHYSKKNKPWFNNSKRDKFEELWNQYFQLSLEAK